MKIASVGTWTLFAMVAACGASSPVTTTADGGGDDSTSVGAPDAPSADDSSVTPPPNDDASSAPDGDAATQTDATVPDGSGSDAGSVPYDTDGNVPYTVVMLQVTNGSSTFTETAYIPGPAGPHPVVSFSPGTQQTAAGYASYAKRLASYGMIVLMRDDPGLGVLSDNVAADIEYVVTTWLPAQNAASSSPLFGKVDSAHVGLGGHSRGGQATLMAAEVLPGMVEAWFGVDPVNTWYMGTAQAITKIGSLQIPTTYLGAGISTDCCPASNNYQVLYAPTPSPSVAITAVGASHTQFEDQSGCVLCGLCMPAGTASQPVVLAYSVRYMTAFFARTLLGDTSVGSAFQGAGAPADIAAGLVQIVSK